MASGPLRAVFCVVAAAVAVVGASFGGGEPAEAASMNRREIVVAVVDTGMDINHKSLKPYLWTNPGESGVDSKGRDRATNGIDDDGNGFVDDLHGWDFATNKSDLTDHSGHGTHIAGIIAGGARKVDRAPARQIRLMILKYYDPYARGRGTLQASVQALRYAVRMNAQVINFSGGGSSFSRDEYNVIREAEEKGILLMAAAGNDGADIDKAGFFPASYGLSNIVSVTAVSANGRLLPTSNYGKNSIDIAVLGHNIYSTLPGGRFGRKTGTSQATAIATAFLMRVIASHPKETLARIKELGLRSASVHGSVICRIGCGSQGMEPSPSRP
jgi:thermitase